jgi:acylphosphatase
MAVVRGRVQGVGFRYSALNKARSLGLKGWVRNEADSSVSLRFEGNETDCEDFLEWLAVGPPSASVSSVEKRELNRDEDLGLFQVSF